MHTEEKFKQPEMHPQSEAKSPALKQSLTQGLSSREIIEKIEKKVAELEKLLAQRNQPK